MKKIHQITLSVLFFHMFFPSNNSFSQIKNDKVKKFFSKSNVGISLEQKKSSIIQPQNYPIYELLFAALGPGVFSGDTEETISNGLNIKLPEFDFALFPELKELRFGIGMDMSVHKFKLTQTEKVELRRYYIETTYMGETSRKPLGDIYCFFFKLSISVKLYPLNKGFYIPSLYSRIRPFVGIAYSFNGIEADLPTEGVKHRNGYGFSSFYKLGIDIIKVTNKKKSIFFRLEFIEGIVPDYNVNFLPELRAIRGGRYKFVRFGLGFTFFKEVK